MNVEELNASKEFLNFLRTARNYCEFIESKNSYTETEYLSLTREYLQLLYINAQNLQFVELTFNSDFDSLLSDVDLMRIVVQLSDRIESRFYWHIFDPLQSIDLVPVCGDLVDDLGDIYRDLKSAILLYDKGSPEEIESALWDFKFNFDNHWGDHCMNALYAIHYIYKY